MTGNRRPGFYRLYFKIVVFYHFFFFFVQIKFPSSPFSSDFSAIKVHRHSTQLPPFLSVVFQFLRVINPKYPKIVVGFVYSPFLRPAPQWSLTFRFSVQCIFQCAFIDLHTCVQVGSFFFLKCLYDAFFCQEFFDFIIRTHLVFARLIIFLWSENATDEIKSNFNAITSIITLRYIVRYTSIVFTQKTLSISKWINIRIRPTEYFAQIFSRDDNLNRLLPSDIVVDLPYSFFFRLNSIRGCTRTLSLCR